MLTVHDQKQHIGGFFFFFFIEIQVKLAFFSLGISYIFKMSFLEILGQAKFLELYERWYRMVMYCFPWKDSTLPFFKGQDLYILANSHLFL